MNDNNVWSLQPIIKYKVINLNYLSTRQTQKHNDTLISCSTAIEIWFSVFTMKIKHGAFFKIIELLLSFMAAGSKDLVCHNKMEAKPNGINPGD